MDFFFPYKYFNPFLVIDSFKLDHTTCTRCNNKRAYCVIPKKEIVFTKESELLTLAMMRSW